MAGTCGGRYVTARASRAIPCAAPVSLKTSAGIQCHSVNGKGGKMGMDLSARVDRGFTPALLSSAMWNHAPVMWAAMEGAGIERPKLSPSDAADLFAYLYSTRFFDKPGDAARGKQAFTDRHCAECHGISESRAEGAPPVVKWESLGQPMVLVQQMWDHSSSMREAFARKKIPWQELTAQDLSDILAYLQNLPQTRGMRTRFSFTSGEGGQAIFESKGCVKCHVGKLALEDRLHNLALTEIAVDMWNHAPRMIRARCRSFPRRTKCASCSATCGCGSLCMPGETWRAASRCSPPNVARPVMPAGTTAHRRFPGRAEATPRSPLSPRFGSTVRRCLRGCAKPK